MEVLRYFYTYDSECMIINNKKNKL